MTRERLHRKLFLSYLFVAAIGLVAGVWLAGDGPAWRALIVSAGASALAGATLAYVARTRVGRAIEGITESVRALGAGRYDVPGGPRGASDDEIDELAQALGQTRRQLAGEAAALRGEAARLRAVLEGMAEGVALVSEGRIALANRAFARMLELGGPIEGRTPLEAVRRGDLVEAIHVAGGGAAARVRDVAMPSGRILQVNAEPLGGGSAVVVLLDVTEARSLERMRREFVANASHELRTPVAAIQAVAETMSASPNLLPADRARFERILLAHAGRLARLVADLLDLSKAEAGAPPRLEPLDLREPIADAVAAVRERAEERRIRLEESLPPTLPQVAADRSSMEQVMVNLLENAVKYTAEGGSVAVRAREAGGRVVVEVEDTGMGIPPEHLPRIFERFYRVDASRSRDQGGTGLGLAIVKHLVQLHGGDVTVASTVGRGTTFRVALPLRRAA